MWFGNLVTMKWWDDLWLNESFAEYMSHLAAVENTRWTSAWTAFLAARKLVGYQQDQLPTTHPIVANIGDLADVEVNFDMITYAKGASVLKQLVAWVGKDNFLKGVHAYLLKYAWGNATLGDFLSEIEATSGRELGQWSKLWLEQAGVTLLRPVTVVSDGVYEKVSIVQEIPEVYGRFSAIPHRDLPPIEIQPSLRPHHIVVAGYSVNENGMDRDWAFEVDIDGELTEVPQLAGQVVPDLLLINDCDLAYAKLRLDEAGRARLAQILPAITDPLVRALVWSSLWDSLRDAELPARQYVDLVLSNIGQERSSTTVQSLLARLRQTLMLYVAKPHREASFEQAAERLVHLTADAEPGSDNQLQFFKAFSALARSAEHLSVVGEVLDGIIEVDGLVIDTDLRWELLTDQVAAGLYDEDRIATELARDATMSGEERAAGARAAFPFVEDKRWAWQVGVIDESVSNATQRAVLMGFVRAKDPKLLREFAFEYFAQIEETWLTRSREMAMNIVGLLYPVRSVNDPDIDVLAMTDEWLDKLGARLPALRRLVLSAREEVICARLAQERDAA
jgi:aminopeptidase N